MSLQAMDWNEIAHSYSRVENSRKEIVFPFVRDKLKESRPARLLDFGCGDGTFAMMCRDLARAIFNYDISPEMNLLARETCTSAANISLLATLDEADPESMDAITMNAVWMCPRISARRRLLPVSSSSSSSQRQNGWMPPSGSNPPDWSRFLLRVLMV
jgi:predicted TPR repeat methyltransferase